MRGRKPGHEVSPETRAKISATLKAKGIQPPAWGSDMPPEIRAKISAALKGVPHTEERREAARRRIGERAGAWKGDAATKEAKHMWLARHHPKTGRCEECDTEGPTQYAFLRHPAAYTRNREDYAELCVLCHRRLDAWRH
jgi:hypothetical protein